MNRAFAEATWIRFKMKGADLRRIPSTEEQRALVQDIAIRRD